MDDLIGKKFGRWTVIRYSHKDKNRIKYYICKCECGIERAVNKANLIKGKSQSCGCLNHEQTSIRCKKYNKDEKKLLKVFNSIRARCFNPKHNAYCNYGARGITIYSEWLKNPILFVKWAIANGYEEGLSVDRIDNDKGYTPENCHFADAKVQSRNRRSNLKYYYKGKTLCLSEWAEKLNISYPMLWQRIRKYGWSFETAITKGV